MKLRSLFAKAFPAPACDCGLGGICRGMMECSDLHCEGHPGLRQSDGGESIDMAEVAGGMCLAAFVAVALFLVAGLFAWFVFDNAPLIRLALGL